MRFSVALITAATLLSSACGEGSSKINNSDFNAPSTDSDSSSEATFSPVTKDIELVERAALATGIGYSQVADFPAKSRDVILAWIRLNAACRGAVPEGIPDEGREQWQVKVCAARERAFAEMRKAGYCYGKSWQAGYQMKVHPCSEGDRPNIDSLTEAELREIPSGAYCNAVDSKGRTVFAATDYAVIKIDDNLLKMPLGDRDWSSTEFKSDEQDVRVTFKPRDGERKTGEESATEPMTMTVTADGHPASIPVHRTCGA